MSALSKTALKAAFEALPTPITRAALETLFDNTVDSYQDTLPQLTEAQIAALTPTLNQLVFNTDRNVIQQYNSTDWVDLAPMFIGTDAEISALPSKVGQLYYSTTTKQLLVGNGIEKAKLLLTLYNTTVIKSAFLTLVTNGTLQPDADYNISDITGFSDLYVKAISTNKFQVEAYGLLLIPDYTIAGNNLGQMEWDNIPAIQPDEFVVWGGFYWKNETLSPITPTITNDTTLAGGLTKLSKSVANGYVKYAVDVLLDTSLNVISVSDGFGNKVNVPQSSTTSLIALGLTYENFQWNYNTKWINNEAFIVNCYGIGAMFSNKNDSNAGYISQCSIGANCFLFQNNFTASVPSFQSAYIKNVKLISNAYIYGNELHLSYFEAIELTDWSIDENHLTNLSFMKNLTLDANGSFGFIASSVFNRESGFDGFTYTGAADINNNYLNNKAVIENASNIKIENFQSDKSLDLTGFTNDILSQTISSGKGFFTLNQDFGSDPITSGNAVLINLIPNGAVCDRATLIVNSALSGTGNLEIGIQTDDADYVIAATAAASVTSVVVNTLSNAAAANRSLRLAASGGDITGGTITVKLEFAI